jgi:hypothetical protein
LISTSTSTVEFNPERERVVVVVLPPPPPPEEAAMTVKVIALETVVPPSSVTLMEKLKSPDLVGVPDNLPAEVSERPVGKVTELVVFAQV